MLSGTGIFSTTPRMTAGSKSVRSIPAGESPKADPAPSAAVVSQQETPALSAYFELMDRVVPGFLSTISAQQVNMRWAATVRA